MSGNPAPSRTTDFGYRRVSAEQKKGLVRAVFDSVAPRYDVMNDLMSLGVHRVWKRIFVSALDPRPNRELLDLAGGTGDVSFQWLERGGGKVLLTDINASMLKVARDRGTNRGWVGEVDFVVADAERLPLSDRLFDRVSIAFGLRNCTDKEAVLAEARRVLRPGGRFMCLEFSRLQVVAAMRPVRCLVVSGVTAARAFRGQGRGELPLSGREHSHVPRPGGARRDDGPGGVRESGGSQPFRRDRGDPFGLAAVSQVAEKRVLLIIAGGIAAFKALELIRMLRGEGCGVTCVLTAAGAQFVTPLSLQALSEFKVYTDLFSLTDESEMGHIQLSRSADLVVVAPATADILARMASGIADDLATTLLLATDKPVLAAPAMNVRMWHHAATQANMRVLASRGVRVIGPNEGVMACNEYGPGRLAEPPEILAAIEAMLLPGTDLLAGRHAVVTSGPTHEPIDPVRYIANRSSGRQGHAIAAALATLGARVTLVSGPVSVADPPGVSVQRVETAREMLDRCVEALPADVAVCAAAVADWRVVRETAGKIKKVPGAPPPSLELVPNPDILATLSRPGPERPCLVIGFAAETDDLMANAAAKRVRKGCDWIVANDVSPASGNMGGEKNTVHLITEAGVEDWPRLSKEKVARRLAVRIAEALA